MKVFVSALAMPKDLKKDELGRLGRIQKTKTHQQPAKRHRSGNTGVEQPGCQASFRLSPSFKPSAGVAPGTEAERATLELKACTTLLSAVIIHLVAGLGSKSDLLCTDKNNIYESQDALGARSLLFPSCTAPGACIQSPPGWRPGSTARSTSTTSLSSASQQSRRQRT